MQWTPAIPSYASDTAAQPNDHLVNTVLYEENYFLRFNTDDYGTEGHKENEVHEYTFCPSGFLKETSITSCLRLWATLSF